MNLSRYHQVLVRVLLCEAQLEFNPDGWGKDCAELWYKPARIICQEISQEAAKFPNSHDATRPYRDFQVRLSHIATGREAFVKHGKQFRAADIANYKMHYESASTKQNSHGMLKLDIFGLDVLPQFYRVEHEFSDEEEDGDERESDDKTLPMHANRLLQLAPPISLSGESPKLLWLMIQQMRWTSTTKGKAFPRLIIY